ncbi:MAG TPA: AAA family ATPase [Edaphobacter sp.]
MDSPFVILTGASGSGKTAIADYIAQSHSGATVFRFDSIGVPDAAVMASYGDGYQPGGAWQRAMTLDWIDRIASLRDPGRPMLFEGQMRIAFIKEAITRVNISLSRIVLVDCDDVTRFLRLAQRGQPDLADENIARWALYLREEAVYENVEILDTTSYSLTQSAGHVLQLLGLQASTP